MGKKVACMVWILCLVVAQIAVPTVVGISCSDAVNALIPCGSYLMGAGAAKPTSECCRSAQSLNKLAASKESRKALCLCLKQTGPSFGVKPERAKQFPSLCKLKLSIAISPDVNCDKA